MLPRTALALSLLLAPATSAQSPPPVAELRGTLVLTAGGQVPDAAVVGGPAAAFDRLPGFVVGPDAAGADPRPGSVGLRLGKGAAVTVTGRRLRASGGTARVVLAPGAGRPRLEQVLEPGGVADLFQLRRAAANRAAADPFPPARPRDPVVGRGALVIVGGGGTTPEI